jgi:hypothetical protein
VLIKSTHTAQQFASWPSTRTSVTARICCVTRVHAVHAPSPQCRVTRVVRAQPRVLVKQDFFWSAPNQGCIWPSVCTCVCTSSVVHWHVYLLIHELVWPRARTCEHWNTLQAPSCTRALHKCSQLQGSGRSAICWSFCQQKLLTKDRDVSCTSSGYTCTCSLLVQRVRQMTKGAPLSAKRASKNMPLYAM